MGESHERSLRSFHNVGVTVSECKAVTEGKTVWELRNWKDPKDFNLLKKHATCVVQDGDGASLRFFLKEEKYSEKDLIKGYSPTTEVECLSLYTKSEVDFGFSVKVTVDYLNEGLDANAGPSGYRSVPVTHLNFETSRTELLMLKSFILLSSKITKHTFGEFEPIEEIYPRPSSLRYGITVRFYKCSATFSPAINNPQPSINMSDEIPNVSSQPENGVSRDIEQLFSQKENFSDLKLESKDGVLINTHKFVLAARSSKLRELILGQTKTNPYSGTIKISDVNAKPLMVILNWVYSGKLDEVGIAGNVIEEVIVASAKYELEELINLCDEKLISVCNTGNMLRLFQLAQKHGMQSAVKPISTYISKNIEKSVAQDEK